MKSGTVFRQGEIVFVPFPFSNLDNIKKRPVLILSKTKDNSVFDDLITCAITANLKQTKYSVFIDNKDLESGTIPVRSRIMVDKLFTIEKSLVVKRLARLSKNRFQSIKKQFYDLV